MRYLLHYLRCCCISNILTEGDWWILQTKINCGFKAPISIWIIIEWRLRQFHTERERDFGWKCCNVLILIYGYKIQHITYQHSWQSFSTNTKQNQLTVGLIRSQQWIVNINFKNLKPGQKTRERLFLLKLS